mmetsp:Transcript_52321/g.106666  ORF Transcript_52321/g.106666 Transcript_52321/m.106666 type:complete len:274 (-) Transcript_52321:263-1084(-)|eukprot:CAMPEP_0181310282 /NCGR_PEP_ID=MMETSP1101-20121128/12500_1 /TAXON_ID=46948 /ORGANISM="Rhodomonas abbreviata, Strain Caron Lab Isolate" /LENGTH=273 /DNA_ID=CAMNT_0023416895 /DNA_START=103 /DNA_END=924 /DNA_ORIENTATION=-
MSSNILRARLRAQETQFMREQDLHAYKHIRNALEGTGELEAARKRVEATLAKEQDNIDILAEVSSARAMSKFKEEDLPERPITIRPPRYEPSKAQNELEEFMRHVPRPLSSSNVKGVKAAADMHNDMMRGRYNTINDFMKSMEVVDEDRRPMTKREIFRAQKSFQASRGSAASIFGAFAAGTALCVAGAGASWMYTKSRMGVKDTKEYAAKMREATPDTKAGLAEGVVGATVKRFKSGIESRVSGQAPSFAALQGMQKRVSGQVGDAPIPKPE